MFGVALSFGDLTATLQTQGDYNSMVMEDMCNQARARSSSYSLHYPMPTTPATTRQGSAITAMRRDPPQEDE